MVVFCFAVAVFIKDAVVNRNDSNAVGPEQSNQVDSIDDFFLLARPMPVNKGVKVGIRFLKRRVIKNKDAALQINLRSGFRPERFGIGFESGKQASKSVVRGSVFALRLNTFGFGGGHIARRGDDKVNIIFVSYFWRIHSLFLSNICSTA